jgi:hypothetical protein
VTWNSNRDEFKRDVRRSEGVPPQGREITEAMTPRGPRPPLPALRLRQLAEREEFAIGDESVN